MLREEGSFSVGGAAETTNGVKTQHRLASVYMRSATTSHDTLPGIDRVFVFLEQGLWSSTKQRHDTNGLVSRPASLPFVCHLKVVESSRGRGLTQKPPQYGKALRNLSPTKPLIVILSWCGGICSAPTAKSPASLCGRWNEREGCCVYTCALSGDLANCKHRIIDGTRLPGLYTFSWSKSHHMANIWIWPLTKSSTIWICT